MFCVLRVVGFFFNSLFCPFILRPLKKNKMAIFSTLRRKGVAFFTFLFCFVLFIYFFFVCLFTCLITFLYLSSNLVGTMYQYLENYLPIYRVVECRIISCFLNYKCFDKFSCFNIHMPILQIM